MAFIHIVKTLFVVKCLLNVPENKRMSQLPLKNMTLVFIDFHTARTLSYNHDKRL